jgi:hypothetical protein
MKREILSAKRNVCGCCPGHDDYPNETYRNRRSKKARARDKKLEHQHIRSINKRYVRNLQSILESSYIEKGIYV